MCAERQVFAKHVVKSALQAAICYHGAVYELQRTGSSVARIRKRLLLVALALKIQSVKSCPRHVDLTSYLKLLWPV